MLARVEAPGGRPILYLREPILAQAFSALPSRRRGGPFPVARARRDRRPLIVAISTPAALSSAVVGRRRPLASPARGSRTTTYTTNLYLPQAAAGTLPGFLRLGHPLPVFHAHAPRSRVCAIGVGAHDQLRRVACPPDSPRRGIRLPSWKRRRRRRYRALSGTDSGRRRPPLHGPTVTRPMWPASTAPVSSAATRPRVPDSGRSPTRRGHPFVPHFNVAAAPVLVVACERRHRVSTVASGE